LLEIAGTRAWAVREGKRKKDRPCDASRTGGPSMSTMLFEDYFVTVTVTSS